jgi:hypothetical protein
MTSRRRAPAGAKPEAEPRTAYSQSAHAFRSGIGPDGPLLISSCRCTPAMSRQRARITRSGATMGLARR